MALSPYVIGLILACAHLVPSAAPPPVPRVEYFVAGGPDGSPLAVVAWRRLEGARGVLLERDVVFANGALRVLHDERFDLGTPRLVWRELRVGSGAGRTWLAEEARPGELRTMSWGTHAPTHGRFALAGSVRMPLGLVEELRRNMAPTRCTWLDPLAARPEEITLEVTAELPAACATLAAGDGEALRCVICRRLDGSVARRFVLRGTELLGYQWADGAPWALRVDAADGRALEASWRSGDAPLEAAAGRCAARSCSAPASARYGLGNFRAARQGPLVQCVQCSKPSAGIARTDPGAPAAGDRRRSHVLSSGRSA